MAAHFIVCCVWYSGSNLLYYVSCGNSEETTQCHYKIGGLTVDATRDTTNRVAVAVHHPLATTEVKFLAM